MYANFAGQICKMKKNQQFFFFSMRYSLAGASLSRMFSLAPLALVLLAAAAGGPVRAFPPTVVIFVHGHGDFLFGFFPKR
jgi:hypothetical protein